MQEMQGKILQSLVIGSLSLQRCDVRPFQKLLPNLVFPTSLTLRMGFWMVKLER